MSSTCRIHLCILAIISLCIAQHDAKTEQAEADTESGEYIMDKPGTIRFQHGIIIVGKVEKPQVMIFLPKEKSYYRNITFTRSFKEDIAEPIPFEPVIE